MLLEGKITNLWSVSGGITCWARQYHSPSVINNQSWNCDHLHQAKGKITCCLKVRLLTYVQYLVGSPAEPVNITRLSSLIINNEIAIPYTKLKVRSLAAWSKFTYLWSVSGGITCWACQHHSPSVINNQSWNCDHLHQAKDKITCCLKVRLLTYGQYLMGSPAEPGNITRLPSLIINLEIAITYTKLKVRSLAAWR